MVKLYLKWDCKWDLMVIKIALPWILDTMKKWRGQEMV